MRKGHDGGAAVFIAVGTVVVVGLFTSGASAYCNGMSKMGYGPRTSTAFPPGWNGLSQTPVRGWRSWQPGGIDALTAKNRTVTGWEGQVSLCDLGYCTAGIDEGWEGCGQGVNGTQHYVNGTPAANPVTFPDMKGLVEYGHGKGVKMGWYFNGCGCIEKREPASGWGINYEGDIRRLAEFGFDAVKFDGCGRMCNMTFYAQLMNETGKRFNIENCHWGDCTIDDASSCPTKDWCPFNWYRTSGDSNNELGTWYNNLQTTIRFHDWDYPLSRPGCWAYPDMLQVGRLGCPGSTSGCPQPQLINWTKTHFAAFCIVSSPLVLSIHPSDENINPLLDIIGNRQAIAINEAWDGHPGTLVRTLPNIAPPPPPVAPGTAVVGVPCNRSDSTTLKWIYDESKHTITQGGLCLTCTGWTLPLTLKPCGDNASYFQNFTYDDTNAVFNTACPAGTNPHPLAACLQMGSESPNPVKVDVYRCTKGASQQFTVDQSSGVIASKASNECLAGRGAYNPPTPPIAGVQLWAKPLGNGSTAALFINGNSLEYTASISLSELNVTCAQMSDVSAVKVTDVWTGVDAGPIIDGNWSTGIVAPMSSRFVVFSAAG